MQKYSFKLSSLRMSDVICAQAAVVNVCMLTATHYCVSCIINEAEQLLAKTLKRAVKIGISKFR